MSIYPDYFYNKTLLNCTVIFGTLFNDIKIKRYDKDKNVKKEMKVRLTYAPKDKLLARIEQDPTLNKKTAINLPVISFEMTSLNYDSQRKLNVLNQRHVDSNGNIKSMYQPIPYIINWSVYIVVDKREDGTQIIEQIIPFFNPTLNIPTKLIYADMGEVDDVQVTLSDVTPEDSYEGAVVDRETFQWNLNFTMRMNFFHPVKTESNIIKKVVTNLIASNDPNSKTGGDKVKITTQPGLTAEGNPTTDANESVDQANIDADDNYGFIEEFLDVEAGTDE